MLICVLSENTLCKVCLSVNLSFWWPANSNCPLHDRDVALNMWPLCIMWSAALFPFAGRSRTSHLVTLIQQCHRAEEPLVVTTRERCMTHWTLIKRMLVVLIYCHASKHWKCGFVIDCLLSILIFYYTFFSACEKVRAVRVFVLF